MDQSKINIILIIAIAYLIFNSFYNKKCIEKMSDINDNQINEKINRIYQADIQSIRNLTLVSQKLQKDGLTIPGNLKVEGKFNYLPKGSIIIWTGNKPPAGWALCDGQNNTPDLRGRFVLGMGKSTGSGSDNKKLSERKLNTIGGAENHKLTVGQLAYHGHGSGEPCFGSRCGTAGRRRGRAIDSDRFWNSGFDSRAKWYSDPSGKGTSGTGGNKPHNNMPPFYVLSYIMKL